MEEQKLFLTENIKQEPEEEFVIILPPFQSDKRLLGDDKVEEEEEVKEKTPKKSSNCFICDLCGKSKVERSEMVRHLYTHTKPFKCQCGKSFADKKYLSSHKVQHDVNRPMFRCIHCTAIYSNRFTLRQHVKNFHFLSGEKFNCDKCAYQGKTQQLLRRHEKSHERAYKCTKCEKDYSRNEGLKRHMKSHDRSVNLVCLCTRVFKTERALNHHKKKTHKPGQPIEIDDGKHICKICDKNFTEKGNMIRHIKIHKEGRESKCPICSKILKTESIKRHLDRHETKSGVKRFKCHRCPKSYYTDSDLKYHYKFHDKQFLCDYCNHRCALKKDIRNHLLVHINPDVFQCKICRKRFLTRSYLNQHTRTFHSSLTK